MFLPFLRSIADIYSKQDNMRDLSRSVSMSKKNRKDKDFDGKYRLVPDDIVKNLVEFLDEIQFDAAQGQSAEDVQVINLCNYLISQLINSIEAYPYKKYDKRDKFDEDKHSPEDKDHIIEFPDMSDDEFKNLIGQFDKFLEGWNKSYKKSQVKDDIKKIKKKTINKDIIDKVSLKEIEQFLIDDPELTDYERFELYYEEHCRVQDAKQEKLSLKKMLKELDIKPAKK